jgi:hypothetical protein
MNVKINFSKINDKKETNESLKIKNFIKEYSKTLFIEYLQDNMTEEDFKEFEKFSSMFENAIDPEELNNFEDKLSTEELNNENIQSEIKNILKEIDEENEYFIGKKSVPISKELEVDMV